MDSRHKNTKRDMIVLPIIFIVLLMSVAYSFAESVATAVQQAPTQGGMTGKCICSSSQLHEQPNIAEIKKAAEQGNMEAQRKLGLKYFNGNGLPEDYQKAVEWYQKAAEQGDEMAQWFLGGMYDEGKGVNQNINQALFWYAKAAEQGSSRAQFRLGEIFAEGNGVPKNDMVAYSWYSLAANQGDMIALKKRDSVGEKIPPEQLIQAKSLSASLQAKIDDKKK